MPSGIALGFEKIAVSTTAVGLTVPAGATRVTLAVETDDVRWRDDGTDPTATVGMILKKRGAAGAALFEYVGNLSAIKFIRVTSDAVVTASYYV